MSDRLVVAEIIGNATSGGVKSAVLNYLRNMDRTGIDFHIITYGPSQADDAFKALGAVVHYVPNFINFPAAMASFAALVKEYKFDVVHSHLTSLSVFPLKVAKKYGVPVRICHAHSTTCRKEVFKGAVKNVLKKFCPKYSTKLLACSRLSADWMYGKKAKFSTVTPNAIELDRFDLTKEMRDNARAALGIKEGDFVLLNIARFEYQKNVPFLIDVLSHLSDKKRVKLLLVGDGSQRGKIEKKIRDYDLEDKVRILPERTDIENIYGASDVFVLPSRYEGLPLVGVEAQAAGLPCYFSSAVTSETKVLKNVEYVSGTAAAWAEKIATAPSRYSDIEALRKRGFDIKDQANVWRRLYFSEIKKAD